MKTEMIDLVVRLVFIFLSVLITGYLIPWLKKKAENEEYNEILVFIRKCVESAEKMYSPEEWQKKKAYVLDLVEHKLDGLGIDISDEEINALIEGFVYAVKG